MEKGSALPISYLDRAGVHSLFPNISSQIFIMGRPMWSSVYLERVSKDAEEEEKEREKEREWEIREEEMALAGWTSFIPIRESGLWGMAEGIAWSVDSGSGETPNGTTTTATINTSAGATPIQPVVLVRPDFVDLNLDFEDVDNPARSTNLDQLPTSVWGGNST